MLKIESEAKERIQNIKWYNHERLHRGIDNHRPAEVMMGLKHPTHWPFKQTTKIKQQQDITTHKLSSSLAA